MRYAVARGHQVTLFNRGRTNPGLFKGMTGIDERIGDRAPNPGNYDALKTGEWDVVIDNPTTRPRWVREAAAAVKGRAGQYVFISTISVYADNDTPGADETAALATTTTPGRRERPGVPAALRTAQGARGAGSAEGVPGTRDDHPSRADRRRRRRDRSLHLLAGAHRARRRGAGAAGRRPGADHRRARSRRVGDPLLRAAGLRRLQRRRAGRRGSRCGRCSTASRDGARRQGDVHPRDERVPRGRRRSDRAGRTCRCGCRPKARWPGFTQRSIARALAKGLTFRPFAETVKETMAFYQQQTEERKAQLRAGLAAEREAAVLAAWKARPRGC